MIFDNDEKWQRLYEMLHQLDLNEEIMPSKLEQMVDLWSDKFEPLMEEYEPMYYILNPNAKKPFGAKSDSTLFKVTNLAYLFKLTDAAFKEGYTTAVITKLQYETYTKRSPAIRAIIFYTTDPVPDDED